MPASLRSNSFEGGSSGTTISVANSGGASGDAFSTVNTGDTGPANPFFDNTHAMSGSLSLSVNSPAGNRYVTWTALGTLTSSVYLRQFLYLSAYPAVDNVWISESRNQASTASNHFLVVRFADHCIGGAIGASLNASLTGTVPVTLNQWVRLECRVLPSATAGEIEWRLYNDPTAAVGSFSDTKQVTGQVLAADLGIVSFGHRGGVPTNPFQHWQDELAISTFGWIGPLASGATAVKTGYGEIGP